MRTNRKITTRECPWLSEDLPIGTPIDLYQGYTYDCITPTGVAVTLSGSTVFIELPRNALGQGSR